MQCGGRVGQSLVSTVTCCVCPRCMQVSALHHFLCFSSQLWNCGFSNEGIGRIFFLNIDYREDNGKKSDFYITQIMIDFVIS